MLLVAGSAGKPRFERLQVASTTGSSKVTYISPAAADSLIKAAADGTTATAAAMPQLAQHMDVDVLGPDNAGEAVQQRIAATSNSRKRQEPDPQSPAAAATAANETVSLATAAAVDDEIDDEVLGSGEPTLGQRVADLEQQQAAAVHGEQHDHAAAGTSGTTLPAGPVKADSLGVLLTQALRSSDRALLEQCLGVADERVITNTVKRLVPLDAALLLRAAVERLQSRPARGQQLSAWIQAVLLHHTAYLMAAPGAAPVMSSLYQIIEARLAMQRQLLSLAGRLELLLAQSGAQQGTAAEADAGPQVRGGGRGQGWPLHCRCTALYAHCLALPCHVNSKYKQASLSTTHAPVIDQGNAMLTSFATASFTECSMMMLSSVRSAISSQAVGRNRGLCRRTSVHAFSHIESVWYVMLLPGGVPGK